MNNFDKEFIMNMFLDDSVCTVNELVIAAANVVNEQSKNVDIFTNAIKNEYKLTSDNPISPSPHFSTFKGFYEVTVQNYTDEEYKDTFKMAKTTVMALTQHLMNHLKPGNMSLDKKVHIFLWLMVNDCSYGEVAKLFGVHKSAVSSVFHEIASHLYEQRDQFINWPSVEEKHITRVLVYSRFKFPNCVGFIDACRFKVSTKRSKRDKPDIILLQAVCNEALMFTDIHIGPVGKTKKNKLFKESPLGQHLENFVEFENHILGSSEYKLRNNLITPFTSEEVLTSEEMKFNEINWKTRCYIGHAFELLKERFRQLNHIDFVKAESVNMLITAACILHNFIIINEGSNFVKQEPVICDDAVTINNSIVQTAQEKRQFLCNYVNYIDADEG